MAIFKCKMCGGTIEIQQGESVGVCEYCGTKQTLPRLDDERKVNLYDRANHFRRNNDFDKAMGIYEQILNEDSTDAEAYWSLVLCRYGIEYVEDPATKKRIPTVNRAQYTSIYADEDYKSALQYADTYQKSLYEAEAKAIDEIQKGILEISQKEEPFDVFICYKETGNDGRRTPDSVLATELYHELTREGFKVFFSRITLEDKLGTAYEPYIFAALHSAKVMVALGTKAEYFNAVWVKNEWSRFLALIKAGERKTLIPAYKDMDPYDLPEEFSHLQAQDMSKLGFMSDLVRGINKILASGKAPAVKETVIVNNSGNASVAPLLKRAFMFLEDGDWSTADEYCEKVLDLDPENAEAYLGKLMAELQVRKEADLADCEQPFDDNSNYQKAVRFGDDAFKERIENYRLAQLYNAAGIEMVRANSETEFKAVAAKFEKLGGYKKATEFANQCLEEAEKCRKERIYQEACGNAFIMNIASQEKAIAAFKKIPNYKDVNRRISECEQNIVKLKEQEEQERLEKQRKTYEKAQEYMRGSERSDILAAMDQLQRISGWKDSDELIALCKERIEELDKQEADKKEQKRIEKERKEKEQREAEEIAAKKKKKIIAIVAAVIAVCVAFVIVLTTVIIPNKQYQEAVEKYSSSLNSASVGDIINFGTYEQDNNNSNGKETIEWLVLYKDESKLLVVSKYALDSFTYYVTINNVTWENFKIRKMLNGSFLNSAFDAGERKMIKETAVTTENNPTYNTSGGKNTTDKVFLLSITEVKKYFKSNSDRQCQGTLYCYYTQGANEAENGNCWWWLRSPGSSCDMIANVTASGVVNYNGHRIRGNGGAIRPAMWLKIG